MRSPEFTNLVVMAATFHVLPSAIARRAMPELSWLSPADWYAFDVAATARHADLLREGRDEAPVYDWAGAPDMDLPRRARGVHTGREPGPPPGKARESGQQLHITGDEIPPWER